MSIREELSQLRERIDQLEQQLEPEITEGQYWKVDESILRIKNITDSGYCTGRRVAGCGNPSRFGWSKEKVSDHTLLSEYEVEQALIKEAKRRGYKKGMKVKSTRTGHHLNIDGDFKYIACEDMLLSGNSHVYRKGEWAEIIEDEWEVTDTGYYVTNGSKYVKFETPSQPAFDGFTKKQAQAIANALNKLDRE